MKWYRHNSTCSNIICKTCGKRIRTYSKSRHIPEQLEQFLRTSTEFNDSLDPNDRVYLDCNNYCHCSNTDLRSLISSIKQNQPVFVTWEDYAVQSVALLKQTAMLSSGSDAKTLKGEINTVMYQVFGTFSEDESSENITAYDMDD